MIVFSTGRHYNGAQVIAAELVEEGILFADPARGIDGFIPIERPYDRSKAELLSQHYVMSGYDHARYAETSSLPGYSSAIVALRKAANEHSARAPKKEPEREPYAKIPLYEFRDADGKVVEYLYSDGLALAYYAMVSKHGDTAKDWTVRPYTGPAMSRDDYIHACQQMEKEGGHFITHLAKAYYHADGTNVAKLKRAVELEFDNYFRDYHQRWLADQVRQRS